MRSHFRGSMQAFCISIFSQMGERREVEGQGRRSGRGPDLWLFTLELWGCQDSNVLVLHAVPSSPFLRIPQAAVPTSQPDSEKTVAEGGATLTALGCREGCFVEELRVLVWLAGVSCALTSKASGAPQCLAGAGLPHTGSVTGLGPGPGKWAPGHALLPGNGGGGCGGQGLLSGKG